MQFHLVQKSTNRKTGPIPVSTSPRSTCPDRCPLKENGCYADGGPLRVHWEKVSKGQRGLTWDDFLLKISQFPDSQLWRHNQAGDLIPESADKSCIDKKKLAQLIGANIGKKGFTYTHYEVLQAGYRSDWNKDAICNANSRGFTINLSADSLEEADKLYSLGIGPVTTTLPSWTNTTKVCTPAGRNIIVCPAARDHKTMGSCKECGLCALPDRKFMIGFPAHGFRTKNIDRLLTVVAETFND